MTHISVRIKKGIILFLVCGNFLYASQARVEERNIIVKFAVGENGKINTEMSSSQYKVIKPLVPSLGIYLVQLKEGKNARQAAKEITRQRNVIYAQPDHLVKLRNVEPSDTDFSKQWSLRNAENSKADIQATSAWDLGTGGKDRDGNDLVIAVVDGGMDIQHKDLVSNLWVNTGEIPGNKKDDDGNGYVDDVNGWNAFSTNGSIVAERHGTHVAGIVGATGNNNQQIAGVNWNVKLMPVMAATGKTSIVLEGYGYVLAQKKLWLDSNGKKGANVVVTNSSFGVDDAKCDDAEFVVWNDIYDAMGKVGILSVAATINRNYDVDKNGDVPTGCSSNYLITVTNTDRKDQIYAQAGFGKTTIDIGAPGTQILSTLPNNSTGALTGTSMASPHVAGSVAFLHSVASSQLQGMVRDNPGDAALEVKKLILNNVDANQSLKDITVSQGRLNLNKSAKAAADFRR